jgi:Xaa-Pro aminopeptidase
MRMKNTALLTGAYDWDPALLPPSEFHSRLAQVRNVLAEHRITALVVHGDSLEYGALAYLTGFVPKLGPAFALIGANGPIRILVAGSSAMLPAAKRLTWVEDVRSIGDLKASLAEWLSDIAHSKRTHVGVWGENFMSRRAHVAVLAATQGFSGHVELRAPLETLRLQKSAQERKLLRRASSILAVAGGALFNARGKGCGVRSAALASERAAFEAGAQDVRILASARNGGSPLALQGPQDPVLNSLLAVIAVKFAGYWAEGLMTAARGRNDEMRATLALAAMVEKARPGVTFSQLAAIAEQHIAPYKLHAFIARRSGNSIGLSLEEGPIGEADESAALQENGVYTLRTGAAGEGGDNVIASAMIAVDRRDTEILWSSTNPSGYVSSVRETR